MANVQLNSGEWYDLGRVTSRRTQSIRGVKVRIIKCESGEIVFGPRDK